MKNSSASTWILILIAIGLLVVAWYMSVTKNALIPVEETQSIVIKEVIPLTNSTQNSDATSAAAGTDNNSENLNRQGTNMLEQTPMNPGEILENAAEFEGTLPCADCPGIIATLTLYPNQTYKLDMVYIDRDSSFTSKGGWKYDTNPPRYILIDDKQQYQILNDNTLEALDSDGNPIESNLNYKLNRVSVTEGN